METTLKEGDRVVVTGDSGKAGHYFSPGTVGTIISFIRKGMLARVKSDDGEMWWVAKEDMILEDTIICHCCGIR